MKLHHLSVDEALASLHSRRAGLTSAEAASRLHEFGLNQVQEARRQNVLLRLLKEFVHFFAVILWIAAGLALYSEWQSPGEGMGTLCAAIVAVIVVNGLFSFWQVYRAEQALAALEKLLPHRVKVLRDGAFCEANTSQLVPGDVVSLESGDLVSADCRLVEAFGVRVNNATVTGESLPQARQAGPSQEEDVLHSDNILLAGTTLVSGDAIALVYATGMHTEFGNIASLTQATRDLTFPLQREITRVSRIVAVLATTLGAVFFLIGLSLRLTFWQNFMFAIGIIVANVPEGLLPTVTLALAMAAQRMAKRNVLIRRLPAVETLGSATVICTDKTGTLTQNRMQAHSVYLNTDVHDVRQADPALFHEPSRRRFFECLLLCQTLKGADGNGTLLGDPTEIALVELGRQAIPHALRYAREGEVPFDSDRKRLSTLHRTPSGLVLYCKGALETVLPHCTRWMTPRGPKLLTAERRAELVSAEAAMANGGLRVLAVAFRDVSDDDPRTDLESQLTLAGLVGLEDPPRPEVAEAITRCREAQIKIIMITGDHAQTALGVARRIGLVRSAEPVVITGEQLRRMSSSQLQLALSAPEVLFARVGANQKMRIVQVLQRKGEIVAVTGDGVNDAPALKQADIGIAMGIAGTDVARETADMVLTDDNFASIVSAVEEGRAAFDNVRKFLTYILTSNIPEIVPYLAMVLFRIPLALTIQQILAVDLGTDMLPALALGAEKPDPHVMRRAPRARSERLLSWPLLARAYLFLGLLEALGAMAIFWYVLRQAGWTYGLAIPPASALHATYLQATTACLGTIVVLQIVNVFQCRSDTRSALGAKFFQNPLIFAGIATEILLMAWISYSNWGNAFFGTAPVAYSVWLLTLPLALGMWLLEELRKLLVRRHRARRTATPAARAAPSDCPT